MNRAVSIHTHATTVREKGYKFNREQGGQYVEGS